MSNWGGYIKLKGETEYKKALREISANMRMLTSEMKVATSMYDRNDKSVENLTGQNEVLTKRIAEQEKKVKLLAGAYLQSVEATGESSQASKKLRTDLNNAQATLNGYERQLRNNTKAIEDFGEESEDAGKGVLKLGDLIKANLISGAVIGGLKALGSAMKQVAGAFVDIGKQAVKSYAEYEQLVGGVETMLGEGSEASKKLMQYAVEGYKTAGISANEYMQQITSFSASLINSLDGDTNKAVEIGNMALIDMMDNANKLGSDIGSIQNAYQGFAKQNFTMLDNLKLGYGGTKSEMKRLLEDAEKLSGIKYDISNLADIYQAIHVIQDMKWGMSGTTDIKRLTTIEGSLKGLKASWSNLVTGIANDNADFSKLINNFVDSIVIAGENLLPRISIVIDGIVDLVMAIGEKLVEKSPELIEKGMELINKVVSGALIMLPKMVEVANLLMSNIAVTIIANLPLLIESGVKIIVSLVQGLGQSLPTLIPVIVEALMTMVDTLIKNIDVIIDAGIELILGLADGLILAIPQLIEKIPIIIESLIKAIIENYPKIIKAGGELLGKLGIGIVGAIGDLVMQLPKVLKAILEGINEWGKTFQETGANFVSGIWKGISDRLDWFKQKIRGWVGDVMKFIKKLFGISSPSKLFKDEIGTNLALGIGEGFSDTMRNVSKDMANAIPTEFDANIHQETKVINPEQTMMVKAFKEALKGVKVIMNDREMGEFVTDTVGKVVFT